MVRCRINPSLTVLWMANGSSLLSAEVSARLSPAWRLMLLGDGSPTRHLQLLTGKPVEVDLIDMEPEGPLATDQPDEVAALEGALLRRRAWLNCGTETLMWAESWWSHQAAEDHLHDVQKPIWASLGQDRIELFREVDGLGQVHHQALQSRFADPGPFWCRHYRFFKDGRVLTVIREVFSPALRHWLGCSSVSG